MLSAAPHGHLSRLRHVDEENLSSFLRRIGRFPQDKAIDVARQVCLGLAAATSGRQLLSRLGHDAPAAAPETGLAYDEEYFRRVQREDGSPSRWEGLRTGDPPVVLEGESPWALVPFGLILFGRYMGLLLRFGLLSAIAGIYTLGLLLGCPHSTDPGSWTASATLVVVPLVLVLATVAFRTALAARPGWRYVADETPSSRPA
jgi:hypothetical protein